jgi:hypothetical protein
LFLCLSFIPCPFFTLSPYKQFPSFVLCGSTTLGMVNDKMGGLLISPHAAGLQLSTLAFCEVAFLQVFGGLISTFTSSFPA